MKRRVLLHAAVLVAALSVALLLAEVELRLLGQRPWSYFTTDLGEPTMHESDPVLGWRNKAGRYMVRPYSRGEPTTRVTFLAGGRRATRPVTERPPVYRGTILLVGCSYTQGWAISDEETYGWKLQARFTAHEVLNYGTGAYGTYQALLMLERILPTLRPPVLVLYGFADFHEERNAASAVWLEFLSKYSRRSHVAVPYVTLGDTSLVRHAPEPYPSWPLHDRAALMSTGERWFMRYTARDRMAGRKAVTERLILEMKRLSDRSGARLVVALLSFQNSTDGNAKQQYLDFSRANGVTAVDCDYPLTPDMVVKGEGHPSGEMNTRWASCIGEFVQGLVGPESPLGTGGG